MLGIPDQFLHCSVYLYASKELAETGDRSGGSGFLVGVPLTNNPEEVQFYVVTNEHVIKKHDSPVIRLNRLDKPSGSYPTNKNRWVIDTENDLAVLPLEINEDIHQLAWVPIQRFLQEDLVSRLNIRPGDEVFMIGRFIGHDGVQKNTPSVRFGNISMMPADSVTEGDQQRECFLIDCRSIPGYSGSPVFLMFDPAKILPPHWTPPHPYDPEWHGPWLLGVDSFHVPHFEPVLTDKESKEETKPPLWVSTNSGMAGAIPAWKLRDLLNDSALKSLRQDRDNKISEQKLRDLR